MKRIAAIIQARKGSTRLPNKVMAEIEGISMLEHLIIRLKRSRFPLEIIISTTTSDEDKEILSLAEKLNIKSYAGKIDDVLDRYYQTASTFGIEIIARITADCPLIDPEVFDLVLEYFLNGNYDYVSNTYPPTYPDGLDVEVFNFEILEKAWKEAKLASEREHVTSYIRKNEEMFKLGNFSNKDDLSQMRWTVDEKEDLEFVRIVYKNLYPMKKIFLMNDILELLRNKPELMKINNQFTRNEGYLKSLQEDKIVK